ncbi:Uncharacterized protein PBTT_10126 [Plasmodiophora brassicae]|uniref:Uncharacterized protein n=1 Tax=Plasmodiophora brassicae TaxID=37360 RepID=A0A0G4IP09_PLABS|nr:hypothetical protein PBRA_005508 [Plasmodiophora brassicae]
MSAIKFLFVFALVFAAVAYAADDDAAPPADPSNAPGFFSRIGTGIGRIGTGIGTKMGLVKDDSTGELGNTGAIDGEPVADQNKFVSKNILMKAGLATEVDGKMQMTRAGAIAAGAGAVVAAGATAAAVVGKDGMQKGYAAMKDKVATYTGYKDNAKDDPAKNSATSVYVGATVIAAAAFAVLA